MTEYYTGEGYQEDERQKYLGETWEAEAPVLVQEITERAAPEYGGCMTWPISQAGVGQPVQILQRRLKRSKAKIYLNTTSFATEGTQTAPGAGNNFTYTNNSGVPQTLVSIRGLFTSDAVVGNRNIVIIVQDAAGNEVGRSPNNANTPASSTLIVNGLSNISAAISSATGTCTLPLPAIVLQPGWSIRLVAGGIDPGDTWTGIVLSYTTGSQVIINSKLDPLQGGSPQGFTIPSGLGGSIEWESQQPCYAIAVGSTAVLAVIDEAYAER